MSFYNNRAACTIAQAPYGNYSVAMDHVAMGHKAAFHAIRAKSLAPVGCVHSTGESQRTPELAHDDMAAVLGLFLAGLVPAMLCKIAS